MPRDPLPLSVLLALGLASCGPCLSPVPAQPCLSFLPPEEPEEPVAPCLSIEEPPPETPPQPCLSIAPPPEDPPVRPCLSVRPLEPPPIPEIEEEPTALGELPPPRPGPCLSMRRPDPHPEPDPETLQICLSEDVEPEPSEPEAGASLEGRAPEERRAVLARLAGIMPEDVLRKL
jgi:hypothetical protein